jgi:hypothetical protein
MVPGALDKASRCQLCVRRNTQLVIRGLEGLTSIAAARSVERLHRAAGDPRGDLPISPIGLLLDRCPGNFPEPQTQGLGAWSAGDL